LSDSSESQEVQNVLRAIRKLSPQERQFVAQWVQGKDDGIPEPGQPGANDGNADSEPSSDAQHS